MKSFLLNLPDRMTDFQVERFLQTVYSQNKGFLHLEGTSMIQYVKNVFEKKIDLCETLLQL